ncbi:MAG: TetR/AcrR family transcriptional regulator [Mycobacterium sp.]
MATRSASQSRAAATRQDIINAAVELFVDRGYGETRLGDIVERAGVTTGAFYYHFDSKSVVAEAIMAQGWPKALAVMDNAFRAADRSGLERVILMTFALSSLLKQDRSVWIANHLNQAFGQLSEEGRRGFESRARQFVARVSGVVGAEEIRPDISPTDVGNQVWITVHGCHLLSDALDDDVIARLARSWHMLLPAMVPADRLAYIEEFVDRTAGNQRPS